MPLPEPNTPWPPKALAPALERMRTWDAWWAGDTDALADVYGQAQAAEVFSRAQFAGGIRGAMARMWWGRPPAAGEPATKLHVPLASDICRASADLLFSEPITATAKDDATTDALDEFLGDGTMARFLEGAETAAGLGGNYYRVAHHPAFDDAWIDVVAPDMVAPEWIGGRLVAATLWWTVQVEGDDKVRDPTVWRHLERHEKGVVFHGLYKGDGGNLGRLMALTDHPATRALAAEGSGLTEDAGIETGYPDGLDIVYVPNMRPQRRWRRSPMLSPFGRPDLDGIEPILDALDEVWSSWLRDIRLAKGRVVVPETFLDNGGPGKGAAFDPDREVFTQISAGASIGGEKTGLTVVQFDIRVEEHERSAQALVAAALRTAGYSAQTFGEADDVAATATEVVARERRSYITRGRKVQYLRPELVELLTAWLAIRAHACGKPALDPTELTVAFPDAVSEDMGALATTASLLNAAKSASIETRVRMLWPEADDTWITAEVARIRDEDSPSVVLPTFGDNGDENDIDDEGDDEPPEDDEDDPDPDPADEPDDTSSAAGRRRARTSA